MASNILVKEGCSFLLYEHENARPSAIVSSSLE
jgi:hypothetical protein